MRAPLRPLFAFLLAALLLAGLAAPSRAQTLDAAAARLARGILSGSGRAPSVRISFENRSSLSARDAAAARKALETQLAALGAPLAPSAPAAAAAIHARVTLSDRLGGFVLVAEIDRSAADHSTGASQPGDVAIVSFPASALARAASLENAPAIEKRLVWQQRQPMADFLEIPAAGGAAARLAVLEPGALALYRGDAPGRTGQAGWRKENSFVIPRAAPWPRDLRGELSLAAGPNGPAALAIILPGIVCALPAAPPASPGQTLDCQPEDEHGAGFPMSGGSARLAPRRNFFLDFSSSPRPGELPPFFSAALMLPAEGPALLAVAATDGRAFFYTAAGEAGRASGWGSELIALKTGCGRTGWQILAAGSGDWTAPDSLRAYEIEAGEAAPSGDPISFPGPIVALWPNGARSSARAVVRNLQTGNYEAYRLALSCAP